MERRKGTDAATVCPAFSQGRAKGQRSSTREKGSSCRKEARKRREAIPKLAPMTPEVDVLEYLETFEENMKKREWSTHLSPLLNNDYRLVTLHLEPEASRG